MKFSNSARLATIALLINATFCGVALAGVIAPTATYSAYTGGPMPAYYAGDAAEGEMSRLYSKFQLPTFSANTAITSAFLNFDASSRYDNASNPLGLFTVSSDAWTTATSWDDKAALGTLVTSLNPSGFTHYSLDVTAFINSQYLGDGVASLALAGLTEGQLQNSWTYFFGAPTTLDVTIGAAPSDVPEPASMALLGLGLAALGAVRRRRIQK